MFVEEDEGYVGPNWGVGEWRTFHQALAVGRMISRLSATRMTSSSQRGASTVRLGDFCSKVARGVTSGEPQGRGLFSNRRVQRILSHAEQNDSNECNNRISDSDLFDVGSAE